MKMENNELLNINSINKKTIEVQKRAETEGNNANIKDAGIVLLKNFNKGTTSSGSPKYSGTIANIDEAKFNVWSNSIAFEYFENLPVDEAPHVVLINFTISKFGIVIDDIRKVDGYNPDSFIFHKYSVDEISSDFVNELIRSKISRNAITVIKSVLHMGQNDIINKRIAREYAAYSHHDNCPTGLLSHMLKCIKIYNGIKNTYNFLCDERTNDLMVIGLALHDLGKIYEMCDGVYQKHSFITHRGLGFEHLLYYKEMIVDLYDDDFFYMLSSVVLQHHGEFGENPKTLYAYLVHIIDDIEAQMTSIDDLLSSDTTTTDASGTKIKYNSGYLNILSNPQQ